MNIDKEWIESNLTFVQRQVHSVAAGCGWWTNLETGESLQCNMRKGEKPKRNVAELLCLVHSEISEAMEGHRKCLMDDKLPNRPMLEVELADALIRIMDMAEGLGLDLGGAVAEKLAYNLKRADHKPENRMAEGGKKF
jgi:NTP pyrophosphatase (non-canonical NTP hydrolase)